MAPTFSGSAGGGSHAEGGYSVTLSTGRQSSTSSINNFKIKYKPYYMVKLLLIRFAHVTMALRASGPVVVVVVVVEQPKTLYPLGASLAGLAASFGRG